MACAIEAPTPLFRGPANTAPGRDGIHSPGAYSPKAAAPPGAVNHMEVETASDLPARGGPAGVARPGETIPAGTRGRKLYGW